MSDREDLEREREKVKSLQSRIAAAHQAFHGLSWSKSPTHPPEEDWEPAALMRRLCRERERRLSRAEGLLREVGIALNWTRNNCECWRCEGYPEEEVRGGNLYNQPCANGLALAIDAFLGPGLNSAGTQLKSSEVVESGPGGEKGGGDGG